MVPVGKMYYLVSFFFFIQVLRGRNAYTWAKSRYQGRDRSKLAFGLQAKFPEKLCTLLMILYKKLDIYIYV